MRPRQKPASSRPWPLPATSRPNPGSCGPPRASPDCSSNWARQPKLARRTQRAKPWELRAATSLARLWQQLGRRAEAHELLAPIYGWFTEGFDTADLQEGKTLLKTIGRQTTRA